MSAAAHDASFWTKHSGAELEYVAWADAVVAGCRSVCEPLELVYDEVAADARALLARASA